jgi:hypothetical protein
MARSLSALKPGATSAKSTRVLSKATFSARVASRGPARERRRRERDADQPQPAGQRVVTADPRLGCDPAEGGLSPRERAARAHTHIEHGSAGSPAGRFRRPIAPLHAAARRRCRGRRRKAAEIVVRKTTEVRFSNPVSDRELKDVNKTWRVR